MQRTRPAALLAVALGLLLGSCGAQPETQPPPTPAPSVEPTPTPQIELTFGLIARPVRGTVSPDDLKAWGLPDDSGLMVAHAHQEGPAMRAGLRDGDVIHSLGGQAIDSVASLDAVLEGRAPGDAVVLRCWRDGVPQDVRVRLEPAADVYRRACDGGDPEGCFSLGAMLAEGRGGAQNPARAAAFLKKGCDGGSAEACVRVADAHLEGSLGLQQNVLLAASLYEKACEARAASGCLALAGIYGTPGGSLESQDQAAALYQRACGWRVAEACHQIALRFASGNGVAQDAQRSSSLHRVACDLGSSESCALVVGAGSQ
jgi:hypothetical protein